MDLVEAISGILSLVLIVVVILVIINIFNQNIDILNTVEYRDYTINIHNNYTIVVKDKKGNEVFSDFIGSNFLSNPTGYIDMTKVKIDNLILLKLER